ncbi:hypothetical protein FF80_03355 [Devosia sp. LC5]|uniref:hypothetical protein n=1 Tax=Devosia sp. LC5 TaxID=1502724 RepID=UPI0004E3AA65|nr:hypothetical protein [Devosia sp. LC5]KFC62788.1 hypothetical protein FF80_03355 [Devosia sp. LC5]
MTEYHLIDGERVALTPAEAAAFKRPPTPPAIVEVKAECRRRILLVMTEDKQRNTLAAGQTAVMQYGADPANWPVDLQQQQAEASAAWAIIVQLRARSDAIEAMNPIPLDFRDDAYWTQAA